jgi:hypothetical protein
MSYLNLQQHPQVGCLGNGPGCGCQQCGQKGSTRHFIGDPATAPAGPRFRVDCPNPPGCPPTLAGRCGIVVREAVVAAISLAENAATKLDATLSVAPINRDADMKETVRLFRFFFGHDPSRPVPWAGNKASGAVVAVRFRAVAHGFRTRGTVFHCDPTCTANATTCASPQCTPPVPNVVNLCPAFWNPPAGLHVSAQFFRGGVVLHEMLHLLFPTFFHHPDHSSGDPVRRRDNAHCYEAFALRVAKHGADHVDVTNCRSEPV